jgi:hypothetical protein
MVVTIPIQRVGGKVTKRQGREHLNIVLKSNLTKIMENQLATVSEITLSTIQSGDKVTLDNVVAENPVIQRALGRLKESQSMENPHSGFKNHGSHSTHSKGMW